jgi:hypothetical protein
MRGGRAMIDCAIYDMDGTLCDISGIRHYVERPKGKKNFDAFHRESINAPAHQWVVDDARARHAAGMPVFIVTAREMKWLYTSMVWLSEKNVPYEDIYMRRNKDYRKDVIIKREILAQIRHRGFNPVIAHDDNPSIIELWESEGIETVVVPGWVYDLEARKGVQG